MTKFVKVVNNKVINYIVADQEHINTLPDKDFYIEDDGTKFKSAGKGDTYDALRDAFISPKPFNSWTLNETTCQWEAPVVKPDFTQAQINSGGYYAWNEETKQWDFIDNS